MFKTKLVALVFLVSIVNASTPLTLSETLFKTMQTQMMQEMYLV